MSELLQPPEDDGLYTPLVKPWSSDKHHFLARYINAFTNSMKQKGWKGLHYIDLFAGAGIENVEGRGLEWGSPLIAAKTKYPFSRLHLVEKEHDKYTPLVSRVQQCSLQTEPQIIHADTNEVIEEVSNAIPQRALSLAFLDPYGLHLDFRTLRVLAGGSHRRMDLIIFFPDHLDALRNWRVYYKGKPNSNLTRVLGTDEWEQALNDCPPDRRAQVLKEIYVKQIQTLGYNHFEYERISHTNGGPLYLLIFCCKHHAGGTIWRNVSLRKPGGQNSFSWG